MDTIEDQITESASYKKLLSSVEKDESGSSKGVHNYRAKLDWVVARAKHYAERTGLSAIDILNAWEERRDYWYMNYYQDSNQPEIKDGRVRMFDTVVELHNAVGKHGFRCPSCAGVSTDAHKCNSGVRRQPDDQVCDWKSYGLFGTLGKGVHVFVKEKVASQEIFFPVAWEQAIASAEVAA